MAEADTDAEAGWQGPNREIVGNVDGLAFLASQDVEPFLDHNKATATMGHNGWTKSRDLKHVASVPLIIVEKWKNELGVDVFNPNHAAAVARLLNDPDWAYLRTSAGRV